VILDILDGRVLKDLQELPVQLGLLDLKVILDTQVLKVILV
jgi:hypothetical protein